MLKTIALGLIIILHLGAQNKKVGAVEAEPVKTEAPKPVDPLVNLKQSWHETRAKAVEKQKEVNEKAMAYQNTALEMKQLGIDMLALEAQIQARMCKEKEILNFSNNELKCVGLK